MHSMIALDCWFLVVIGLRLSQYSSRHILANSEMNSVPWSNMICCGSGYLVNNINSATFATLAVVFLGLATILNQSVTVSIMVTHQILSYFLPLCLILYGAIRSTHRVSQVFTSDSLVVSFPYFLLYHFSLWQDSYFRHRSCTCFCRPFQSKFCCINISVRVSPGWHCLLW